MRAHKANKLVSLSEDLADLMSSGFDLESALVFLAKESTHTEAKQFDANVLHQVLCDVRQGEKFSAALAHHPIYFDAYFVGMVKSGEASGNLAKTLSQLAKQLERSEDLKNQINSALIYPVILCVTMAFSLILVLGIIVPQLSSIFDSFSGELSVSATLLLSLGQFLQAWGKPIIIVISLFIIGVFLFQEPLKVKRIMFGLLTRLPFISPLIRQIDFARFTSTLSSLLESGLNQVEALRIAAESFQEHSSKAHIENVIEQVSQGNLLSEALSSVDGLGRFYSQTIANGERSGKLPQTLALLAQRLEKDFNRRSQRLASLIEPALILTLGGIIAFIVITVFSALQTMSNLPL